MQGLNVEISVMQLTTQEKLKFFLIIIEQGLYQ